MKKEKTKAPGISRATIDRLPLYFRTLRLVQDEGLDIISADELGRRLGITPEQHDIHVGLPATMDILATKDVNDMVTTERKREEAAD